MSEKRRDNKGRILATGESLRNDGRYAYKYTDASGKVQFIYSWKLTPMDRTPKGKRDDLSLREKIKQIQRNLDDGIDTNGSKMTVCQLYEKQNASRTNVKENTVIGRKRLMQMLKEDAIGSRSIDSIKPSDAKEWCMRMHDKGYAYSTINNSKRSLLASFGIAVEDDLIRKNPFRFNLSDLIENDAKVMQPLTEDEERRLLDFVKSDNVYKKYFNAIIILLNTGLRISELCGLTTNDIDLDKRVINVDHQLLYTKKLGYYINTPKTESGIRQIPMNDNVYEALQDVLAKHKQGKNIMVDVYSDFLFLNQKGYPMTGSNYGTAFRGLVKKYNKHHDDKLPSFTPHVLRHTFCTRLANKNMNPKSLQYIMGHANINITLNLYAHASLDTVKAEMARLCI